MSTQIAIGFSQVPSVKDAALQACLEIKRQLNTSHTDMVICFTTSSYTSKESLDVIHSALSPSKLIGSQTSGIIIADGVFNQGIAVLAINSSEIQFGISRTQPDQKGDLRGAGFEWGRRMHAEFKSRLHNACLMFCDYSLHNHSAFIRGAQEVLGIGLPLMGGVSSDNYKYNKAAQMYQKELLNNSVVGLLIGGGNVAVGFKHGFKPLGKPRTITTAENNIIHSIDGQPAINIYKEFLGPQAEMLNNKGFIPQNIPYPLGIYWEEKKQYLIKNAVDILADGSIVCQGEIPQGAEVHLMIGNKDTCRNSAIDAAKQVKDALGGRQAKLIIIIESAARHKILRNNSFIEIQAIKEILGYTTPMIGMYSFGEITPMSITGTNNNIQIQNKSIMILAID